MRYRDYIDEVKGSLFTPKRTFLGLESLHPEAPLAQEVIEPSFRHDAIYNKAINIFNMRLYA